MTCRRAGNTRCVRALGSKQAWVTLQRPPPDILTLPRTWAVFSTMSTRAPGCASALVMAAKKPAAPPPTTTRSQVALIRHLLRAQIRPSRLDSLRAVPRTCSIESAPRSGSSPLTIKAEQGAAVLDLRRVLIHAGQADVEPIEHALTGLWKPLHDELDGRDRVLVTELALVVHVLLIAVNPRENLQLGVVSALAQRRPRFLGTRRPSWK